LNTKKGKVASTANLIYQPVSSSFAKIIKSHTRYLSVGNCWRGPMVIARSDYSTPPLRHLPIPSRQTKRKERREVQCLSVNNQSSCFFQRTCTSSFVFSELFFFFFFFFFSLLSGLDPAREVDSASGGVGLVQHEGTGASGG